MSKYYKIQENEPKNSKTVKNLEKQNFCRKGNAFIHIFNKTKQKFGLKLIGDPPASMRKITILNFLQKLKNDQNKLKLSNFAKNKKKVLATRKTHI